MVLDKTLESPSDCKEVKSFSPKGDQPWIFIGRIDAEAEAPILWPPDVKNWLIGKDPDAGEVQRQEEKGMTEDEMVGGITYLMERDAWRAAVHGAAKSQAWQKLNWTELSKCRDG